MQKQNEDKNLKEAEIEEIKLSNDTGEEKKEEKTLGKSIVEYLKEWCDDTTSHGFKNIVKTDSWMIRIAWILLVIGSMSYCMLSKLNVKNCIIKIDIYIFKYLKACIGQLIRILIIRLYLAINFNQIHQLNFQQLLYVSFFSLIW